VQQAEDVLQAALQHHPDDDAIRLKLLEVYHDAGNVAAFNSMAGDFRVTVTEDDSRWIRVAELGHALAPDNELYLAATPDTGGGLDFDVDLSGLEDLGGGQPPEELSITDIPEQRGVVAATPGEVEFNLDESLSGDVVFDEEDNAEGLLENSDEVTTKLDLARAYIDMGDPDGAHSILKEVIEEGSDEQIHEAEAIISQLA
jgi:pilus assembly protein FimV